MANNRANNKTTNKTTKINFEDPDPFQEFFTSARDYIMTHSRQAALIIAAVVGVFLLVSGWFFYDSNRENKAENMYRTAFMETDIQEAVKQYESLIGQYSGTRAAALASYRLGNFFLREEKFDEAIKYYQSFIKQVADSNDLKTLAWGGMGTAYEMKGDLEQALASYEKALKTPPVNAFSGANYQNAARIYEKMENKDKSLEYYRKALELVNDPGTEILLRRKIALLS